MRTRHIPEELELGTLWRVRKRLQIAVPPGYGVERNALVLLWEVTAISDDRMGFPDAMHNDWVKCGFLIPPDGLRYGFYIRTSRWHMNFEKVTTT